MLGRMNRPLNVSLLGMAGLLALVCASFAGVPASSPATDVTGVIQIHRFLPEQPLCRALRPARVTAVLENRGHDRLEVRPRLVLPAGLRLLSSQPPAPLVMEAGDEVNLAWELAAAAAGPAELRLEIEGQGVTVAGASLALQFLPAQELGQRSYLPGPKPARTPLLIGAHHCPLWEKDQFNLWANVLKHPERTPALGFYAQENPQVADWETTWATEHGISFFVYCWYRASQGGPVKTRFATAIEDALFHSRYMDKMKFTIMWENQSRGVAGVADEHDLMTNLLPFWITHYFKHPSYVVLDGRPVLFIYRPEFLIQDLGSVEKVRQALDRMRQACRDAGFEGLYLLGEYRGTDPNQLRLMKQLGLDYTFAYCWYVADNPTPAQAIRTQMQYIRQTRNLAILPEVVTVSQGWSGWRDEGSIWTLPPKDYEELLRQAKDFVATMPTNELGSRLLLLDNWNEWGEGHYLAPYRQYGFGYLDAVRRVFSDAPEPHTDLIPEDIGMGPYDTAYWANYQREQDNRRATARKAHKGGPLDLGLIGWWAFDEAGESPIVFDYSGHRLGGTLHGATRAAGLDGQALVCQGGCVVVENRPLLSLTSAVTIACWVKTDLAGQDNKWLVNRVFSGGTDTGYRLGVLEGRPCFEVPQTDWSHHLKAGLPLPTGRWVHLAGTFDGRVMRIYVDGAERGALDRPGPIMPNDFHLCLGSYEVKHPAHFTGLLDEVKLYNRALSSEEIQQQAKPLAR